jgi:CxxC motif-containing protein (DUF1111 family)
VFAAVLLVAACGRGDDGAGPPPLDPALGGAATRAGASGVGSFELPITGLTNEQRRAFEVGDSFFTKNWVTAPASTEARDGLGPTFNAQACSSCHTHDGRGAPPEGPGDTASFGLLLRLSVPAAADGAQDGDQPNRGVPGENAGGAPDPEPTYGGQLQDRAVLGVRPEGRVQVTWETVKGTYEDGTPYELRRPVIEIVDLARGPLSKDVQISPRLAPQVIGVGLLEAVPEADVRASADPDDSNGDGVSGRVNVVPDPRTGETKIGRFGWKANVATVEAQASGAFHGDIGITSSLAPDENCGDNDRACNDAPNGGSPEIEDDTLGRVTFYNRTLAVPAMRHHEAENVRAGAEQFGNIGCASCHTQTMTTGDADVPDLAHQTIHPYTDLLLHDMGPNLADGRPDFLASGTEWRTPPLWGIGLIDDVNGTRALLHDGRARSIEEAILWHGGEADAAMKRFRALPVKERDELITFLESL